MKWTQCLCCVCSQTVTVANRKTISVQKGTHAPSNAALSQWKAPGTLELQRDVNTVGGDDGELGAHAWTCNMLFRKQNWRGLFSTNMLEIQRKLKMQKLYKVNVRCGTVSVLLKPQHQYTEGSLLCFRALEAYTFLMTGTAIIKRPIQKWQELSSPSMCSCYWSSELKDERGGSLSGDHQDQQTLIWMETVT